MAGRKQAVKNAVPKPGHNYFLSHCQDRAIDEAGSVSGCCAQGSAVIPWVQWWQANIALLSCSRAGRALPPVVNCFLSRRQVKKRSAVAGYPPLTCFRCSEPKGKVETTKKKQQNQSVHKRCLIFLDARRMGHFPNRVTETPLRTTVQQTNPERGVFVNGKCFSTLGREDHSTAIRQTITILSLHKQKYNRRRRMEENEEDVLSWPASQGHCWKRSAFLNET